ncbi:MAG: peptide chain release factor N(5)-glutamine methyltransferase [Deltaproteobacteria bacterium HGW-Deltaproteobacteria-11]|nr:MAG: peptide chain release factor N(5)-glutamine methyltransferase [Deltaproteobacteria bacterium HGW-Deltaproteobacteria-11]
MTEGKALTIGDCVHRAARDFDVQGLASPRLDAEVLLAHILKVDRLYLYRNPEEPLTQEVASAFQSLTARRLRGEPVAYLLNRKEFWSLIFEVNEQVLIPRPDTECLVEEVLKVCSDAATGDLRILDLGTGSGAVGVALAWELRHAHVVATDISPGALNVARRNAGRHGVEQRMTFLAGDLFAPLSEKFDIIVSNPPYIRTTAFQALPPGVRGYEPAAALLAGPEGTVFHERIIAGCPEYLNEGGWLFLEIGPEQRQGVEALLAAAAIFEESHFRRDYAGLDRVAAAKRKQASWTR